MCRYYNKISQNKILPGEDIMEEERAEVTFRRILFPTDFSDLSTNASAYAISLARRYGSKLYVIHVVDRSGEASGMYVPHMAFDALHKEEESVEAKSLRRICSHISAGGIDVESILYAGIPHDEILRAAREKDVDIIVIGTSGTGGVGRLVFGSNADNLIKNSHVPVLAIPPVAS